MIMLQYKPTNLKCLLGSHMWEVESENKYLIFRRCIRCSKRKIVHKSKKGVKKWKKRN